MSLRIATWISSRRYDLIGFQSVCPCPVGCYASVSGLSAWNFHCRFRGKLPPPSPRSDPDNTPRVYEEVHFLACAPTEMLVVTMINLEVGIRLFCPVVQGVLSNTSWKMCFDLIDFGPSFEIIFIRSNLVERGERRTSSTGVVIVDADNAGHAFDTDDDSVVIAKVSLGGKNLWGL